MRTTSPGLLKAKPGSNSQTRRTPADWAISAPFGPEPGDAMEGLFVFVVGDGAGGGDGVDAERRAAEVGAHLHVALQQVEPGGFVAGDDGIDVGEIGRVTGDAELMVFDKADQIAAGLAGRIRSSDTCGGKPQISMPS